MFGMTEQIPATVQRREVDAKHALLRQLLERRGLEAAVLTGADAVAWASGGIANAIERGAPTSPLWLVVRADGAAAGTANVEQARGGAEAGPPELHIALHEPPWDGADPPQ